MISVVGYQKGHKQSWNEFVGKSKNGVFLFNRDYMEYHADRFSDYSLMFFDDERLIAIIPANRVGETVVSHGGLTFGGVISDTRMRTGLMLRVFNALRDYLRVEEVARLIYKAVPHIYHSAPSGEDLYALFRNEGRLVRRELSSTIGQRERVKPTKGRKWSYKQSLAHGLEVRQTEDFESFMTIESELLRSKYGLRPVHTAAEMRLLAGRFPNNIQLFAAYKEEAMLAGVVTYVSQNVAHAQYIAASAEGKRLGALDRVLNFLINEYYTAKPYFDFGISTEKGGLYLNDGLLENKESFGARAVVYDCYELMV
jgi:Acetyltransferase (GNAT) domain